MTGQGVHATRDAIRLAKHGSNVLDLRPRVRVCNIIESLIELRVDVASGCCRLERLRWPRRISIRARHVIHRSFVSSRRVLFGRTTIIRTGGIVVIDVAVIRVPSMDSRLTPRVKVCERFAAAEIGCCWICCGGLSLRLRRWSQLR